MSADCRSKVAAARGGPPCPDHAIVGRPRASPDELRQTILVAHQPKVGPWPAGLPPRRRSATRVACACGTAGNSGRMALATPRQEPASPWPRQRLETGALRRPGTGTARRPQHPIISGSSTAGTQAARLTASPMIACCKSRSRTYRLQRAIPDARDDPTRSGPPLAGGRDTTLKRPHGRRWRGTLADKNPDMQFETVAAK